MEVYYFKRVMFKGAGHRGNRPWQPRRRRRRRRLSEEEVEIRKVENGA